jgi:hypothetical protein
MCCSKKVISQRKLMKLILSDLEFGILSSQEKDVEIDSIQGRCPVMPQSLEM